MKIKGVSGRQYVDLQEEILHLLDGQEITGLVNTVGTSELQGNIQQLKFVVRHLTSLIQTFGLCRPEMQLARMELGEATERYLEDKGYDEKNYGAIAKDVLAEMRAKGEMPDEN
jgi:hypothetical protein